MEQLPEEAVSINEFKYANIFRSLIFKSEHVSYPPHIMDDKSYAGIYLDTSEFEKTDPRTIALGKKVGWKFHIVLNQEIKGNVEKAWDILVDLVIKNEIAAVKIIKPDQIAPNNKVITIHAFQDARPNQSWLPILNEITKKFVEQKVYPTTLPKDDYKINGSLYFAHRSDDDGFGNYTKESIIPLENSPFKDFLIEDQGQTALLHESIVVTERQVHEDSMSDDIIPREFHEKKVDINNGEDDNDNGCCNC